MSVFLLCSLLLFGVATASSDGKRSVASILTQVIAEGRKTENIIFSPANIQHSLALLYLGAEGETAAVLQANLKLGKSKKKVVKQFSKMFDKKVANKEIKFQIGTRLYLAEDLELAKSFKGYAKSFNTQVMHVKLAVNDYEKQINQWAHQKTSHKITDLITDNTEALLVNNIYFKAKWRQTFSEQLAENFLMTQDDTMLFKEFDSLRAHAVQLKLKDTKISMLFIQPKADSGGLPGLESRLKEVDLTRLPKEMRKTRVTLKVPKFKIEWDTSLKSALGKLGIESVFNNAPFNRILARNKSVDFSDLRHKTYIQVDMEGIEVASVTGTLPYPHSPPGEVDHEAEHPFFFAIIGKNNVYFAGHVTGLPLNIAENNQPTNQPTTTNHHLGETTTDYLLLPETQDPDPYQNLDIECETLSISYYNNNIE